MKRAALPAVAALSAVLWLAAGAGDAHAQRLLLRGRGDLETDTILQRLTAGEYRLITADTIIAAPDTLRGTIVIAATTAKLENVIVGDLVIIDANVFMRPHSRITGGVTNIAGGLFRAGTATVGGAVHEYLDAPYRAAEQRNGDVEVVGERVAGLFDLDGFGGFHAPTYDRVSGLSATIGARYLLPRLGRTEPELHGWVGYQTERRKLHGGVDAGFRIGGVHLRAGAERKVITNDAWLRRWSNSVTYLASGRDGRDYYDADRYFVGPVVRMSDENRSFTVRLDAQIENARSLTSLDPWHINGDPARPNPPIDDGRVTSLVLDARATLEGRTFFVESEFGLEAAARVLGGDHAFGRFDVGGRWAVEALAGHTFQVRWRFRGPLASDSLPRQRWSILGGSASFFNFEYGDLRGDRLAWVASTYQWPLPAALALPILGRPALEAVHRIGNVHAFAGSTTFTQNVALGVRFRIAYVLAGVDPHDPDDVHWLFGLSIQRRYPWQPD